MFKRKKKKTGCETPEYRRPTLPPNPNLGWQPTKSSGTKPPNPPTSGSNAQKPPNISSSVQHSKQFCPYETPCGWCTKWNKKCDKKIGLERGQRVNINPVDDAIDEPIGIIVNKICASESDHEWECVGVSTGGSTYRCRKCYTHKTIPIKTEILETYIGEQK
jgi:hypothetical protein